MVLKSTRTAFKLLRDEIDELHQVTIAKGSDVTHTARLGVLFLTRSYTGKYTEEFTDFMRYGGR